MCPDVFFYIFLWLPGATNRTRTSGAHAQYGFVFLVVLELRAIYFGVVGGCLATMTRYIMQNGVTTGSHGIRARHRDDVT